MNIPSGNIDDLKERIRLFFVRGLGYMNPDKISVEEIRKKYNYEENEYFIPNYSLKRFNLSTGKVDMRAEILNSYNVVAYDLSQTIKSEINFYDLICFNIFRRTNDDALKNYLGNEILRYSEDSKLRDIVVNRLSTILKRKGILTKYHPLSERLSPMIDNFALGNEFIGHFVHDCDQNSFSCEIVHLHEHGGEITIKLRMSGGAYVQAVEIDKYYKENGLEIPESENGDWVVGYINYSITIELINVSNYQIEHCYQSYIPHIFAEDQVSSYSYNPALCFFLEGMWGGQFIWAKCKRISFNSPEISYSYSY